MSYSHVAVILPFSCVLGKPNDENKEKRKPGPTAQCNCTVVPVVAVCPTAIDKHIREVAVSTGLRWWPCWCPDVRSCTRGGRMDEKKFYVSTGLRWWPCCFVSRRKNSRKRITYIGKLRISACYFSRRLILLWLFMIGLHPHLGPNVGVLVHASSSYNGSMTGSVFKMGAEGLGYYVDAGRCSLELAPLLRVADSVPPLPIRLYSLLGRPWFCGAAIPHGSLRQQ